MRLSVRRPVLMFLLASALATGSACNNNATTTTTPTTTPTTFSVTETFSGTLNARGAASFSFAVQAAGTVSATLTTLTDTVNSDNVPPTIGISLGPWNGTSCANQTGVFTDNAAQGAAIAGTVNE